MSTKVKTNVESYCPEIDLSTITIWDAMKLVDLMKAVSTIINAAISSGDQSPSVDKYLDNWQALFNDAAFDIADVVLTMKPTDLTEQRARNWLLAKVDIDCAEGLIVLAGPGAPTLRDDAFTAGLIAADFTNGEMP